MTDTEVKTESNGQSAPVSNSGDGNQTKKDFTPEEINAKIVRQIEHYFGDYNLPRDKFLKETIKTDDGWVPMETMLNFQRLAALSTDSKVQISRIIHTGFPGVNYLNTCKISIILFEFLILGDNGCLEKRR